MSSADGPGPDSEESGQASAFPGEQVHTQLVEALLLLLIEKGLLTRNDALSVVHTVAQVQQGAAVEYRRSGAQSKAALDALQQMYNSFEALAEHPVVRRANLDNVLQLRPSIHGDAPPPAFPRDD